MVLPIQEMDFSAVKTRTLVEDVSEHLATLVRQMKPGEQNVLPSERKLAEKFGVARGVVREAVKRLEIQGLLEVRRGSGIRAINRLHDPLTASLGLLIPEMEERLLQLCDARAAIEPAVVKEAARRAKKDDVAALWKLQENLEEASDLESAVEMDIQFHRKLAEIAGNEIFKLVLESNADLRRESTNRTIGNVGKTRAAKHHRAIIEAIEARDSEGASIAMTMHIVAARNDLKVRRKK
ncbi:MAG: DNA-binding FadR family transcriptional regulator [Candidatus Omnitrophota bacterium]